MVNNENSRVKFMNKFGYSPNFPKELFFDKKAYGELLQKCIDDNFDYTIELYGTDPNYGTKKHDGIYID